MNDYVSNNTCVACAAGTTNDAGDDASGSNTMCVTCAEDYYVSNNACVACPSGQSNLAGDDSSGQDTSCDTCRIETNQELRDHVDSWITNSSNHPCGEVIGDWEVGRVTDMSNVFYDADSFNANLSNWNTSSVTNLSKTFFCATTFTGPAVKDGNT